MTRVSNEEGAEREAIRGQMPSWCPGVTDVSGDTAGTGEKLLERLAVVRLEGRERKRRQRRRRRGGVCVCVCERE